MSNSTHHNSGAGGPDREPDYDVEDPHGILAMPASSSVARLSSIPPAPYAHKSRPSPPFHGSPTGTYSGLSKSATFPSSISSLSISGSGRHARPIPGAFLTHQTPFATAKYIPPTGAPGYTGEEGWDTGDFAKDWEGEEVGGGVKKGVEMERQRVPRVMKLVGRKEETAGVLTRGLSDVVCISTISLSRHDWFLPVGYFYLMLVIAASSFTGPREAMYKLDSPLLYGPTRDIIAHFLQSIEP
jgi:hypothetical protein